MTYFKASNGPKLKGTVRRVSAEETPFQYVMSDAPFLFMARKIGKIRYLLARLFAVERLRNS
jgi:hypothetical protein